MRSRATRRSGRADVTPAGSAASSTTSRKRKIAEEATTALSKKRRHLDTASPDATIRSIRSKKKLASEAGTAARTLPAGARPAPSFTIHPETTLGAFRDSPPDVSGLPVINQAPREVLIVFAFGLGDMCGELGLGPKVKSAPLPVPIPELDGSEPDSYPIVQVACGGMHAIALTQDGQIVTWGGNDEGALGRETAWDGGLRDMDTGDGHGDGGGDDSDDETLNPLESTPMLIPESSFPGGTRFTCVAAGDSCSFAVTETGVVYGWGTFRVSQSSLCIVKP